MRQSAFVGLAVTVLVSGGLGLAGLSAGTARAEDWCSPAAMANGVCYGPNQWCPGDSLFHLTQNHVTNPINWDMGVCHTYYYVPWGQGNVGQNIWEGANPPPPDTLSPPVPARRRCLPGCAGTCGFQGPARAARSIVGPVLTPSQPSTDWRLGLEFLP
jgi:hypothetical protein